MAYCRWSSDDFQCDMYVYEDISGRWITHIAGKRRKYLQPLPEQLPDAAEPLARLERWKVVMNAQHDLIDIDHPLAGQTFSDPNPWMCAQRLRYLKSEGFIVPDDVIQMLEEEGETEFMKLVRETLKDGNPNPPAAD